MGRHLADVYASLAAMLEAGLGYPQALRTVAQGGEDRIGRALAVVAADLDQGATVAEAFARQSKTLPKDDQAMIRVGEESGKMPLVMKNLAEWHAFRRRLWRLAMTGLAWPAVVVHIGAFVAPLPPLVLGKSSVAAYLLQALGSSRAIPTP